ncbi:O-antigen ligase family protein [Amnibacterium sp. CER49]|uniref:O-antigen ligase family protein n=1 Tax=Amnibacterium sp. CER49 TaxID=3039161 RepID=UPI0024496556|nr:O-antigen ligase family protein [Amnibacterium sp. CER49]MDH2443000.1 O-antigen ligase family protein [Amnibacterium sp. CER49]
MSVLAPLAAAVPPPLYAEVASLTVPPEFAVIVAAVVRLAGRVALESRETTVERRFAARGPNVRMPIGLLVMCLVLVVIVSLTAHGARQGSITDVLTVLVELVSCALVYKLAADLDVFDFARWRGAWTLIVVLAVSLGLMERGRGTYLLPAGQGIFHPGYRDGVVRAQAFFPHPIVFGVSVAAITLMWLLDRTTTKVRILVGAAGILGLLLSDSRGPLAASVIAIAAATAFRFVPKNVPRSAISLALGGLAVAVSIYFSSLPSVYVGGANESEASSQYRIALIQVGSQVVSANPFGLGPGALPPGLLLVDSVYGVLDLAHSVDNTYLIVALQYGLIGLGLVIIVAVSIARRATLRRFYGAEPRLALFAVLVLFAAEGFSVSEFSWVSLTAILGAVCGLLCSQRISTGSTMVARV